MRTIVDGATLREELIRSGLLSPFDPNVPDRRGAWLVARVPMLRLDDAGRDAAARELARPLGEWALRTLSDQR
jgi:hypothetical protein